MRRAAGLLVLATLALAALAFSVFRAPSPAPGERHWAAAPLLAFSIVLTMSGLVALASARRGSLK